MSEGRFRKFLFLDHDDIHPLVCLCVDEFEWDGADVCRVVPVYVGHEYNKYLTDRDVWVRSNLSPFVGAKPFLLACWNSRPVPSRILYEHESGMNLAHPWVINAVRAISLRCVIPVSAAPYEAWSGTEVGEHEVGLRLDFQIEELTKWDAAVCAATKKEVR